ncbi:proteoglycan 4 [Larimichthys crocea]|uniref:proteoglycan 4 n=1 Tax=Larimichthys crocea TaxID=215358 RepID=UPI000F5EF471|nr:proteoglycan 4 [Larimichthys crocea]
MAVAYGAQLGLLSQQYPPPLFPKPGKDNVRLQKLLKRNAKKKASAQALQSAAPFRSSLSPVNEASPDLEHSDHSTPPKTPETPFSLYSNQQPPRFSVRPLYQHVASPYPQRAAYGRATRFSPQTVAMPSYSYSQHVTTVSSYAAPAHLSDVSPAHVPKISLPAFEATVSDAEVKKPAFSTFAETPGGLRPVASVGPTPYSATGGQAFIRPLIVLTPVVKSRSPRPTFKATEPSRSPKPMFDVPKIRLYTASTSYYETSRTPPVYDSAGLTAIGSTVTQSKTTETKQDLTQPPLLRTDPQRKTPTSETQKGTILTAEIKITTAASEVKRATPTSEIITAASTAEIKRATPTAEIKRATPTAEIKMAPPTSEIKSATPTAEIKRATPTAEIKMAPPTSEIKRATPTAEIKRATPTAEMRPTYESQPLRTSAGRPKTPAYHKARAATPVFEISRPNPLLFAVSPITVEPERSRTPKMVSAAGSSSASQSVITTESKTTETILNGDIHLDMTPAAKPIQQSISKSKSEPDLTKEKIHITPAGSQRLSKTPTSEPTTPAVTSHGYQRPKTPTYEASRLMSTLPGYKRPRTPTYGTSPSGVSPVSFQRPKTPTQVAQKSRSGYRGLTPAEYAAYGGIKTYSPAFGISKTQVEEEVIATKEESTECKIPSQEPSLKGQSTAEVSKDKETPKGIDKLHVRDEKVSATPSVPIIIVSQASDTSGPTLTHKTSMVSSQVVVKQEKTLIQETPMAKPPTVVEKTPEKQKVETLVQEVIKSDTKTPEAKHPLPKGDDQDPLTAVRKLLGKTKVQTAEQKSATSSTETKAVSDQKEPAKPGAVTKTKAEGSKPSTAAPALPVKASAAEPAGSEDKGKDKKSESALVSEKKEGDESLSAAESALKVMQKPMGMKSKLSGWSRLKKHMVVEQEEPKFPELGTQKEATENAQSVANKADEKASDKPGTQDENQTKDAPKATKMWDAVLFQMFSTKENIIHQIELKKSEGGGEEEGTKDELKEIPSFAFRLPVLLFSPKFDAKKLKEAASRPVTKISTVFEMGLIGRKGKDEEPKDFNRKARAFTAT